jgi:hypothetical protein
VAHPLDGARAKIARAEYHLEELHSETGFWINGSPYALMEKRDTKPDTYCFELIEMHDPPMALGLIFGDYVHNLRSALDHLVWQFVLLNGRTVPRHRWNEVYFPVVDTRVGEFWEKPPLRWLTAEQVMFIEGFQPYRSGDAPNPLSDLNYLWNADKHRLINPVATRIAKEGPTFRITEGRATTWFNTKIALEARAKVAGWRADPGTQPKVQVTRFPVDIAFGERGRLIEDVPTMRDLAKELIEQAAERFF